MDGTTNGTRFLSYAADTLEPALKPGDTVVMDNFVAHKVAGVRHAFTRFKPDECRDYLTAIGYDAYDPA